MSSLALAGSAVYAFACGLLDSLRLQSSLVFFLSSRTIRFRSAQCFILNGLIFIGSLLLSDYLVRPALKLLMGIRITDASEQQEEAMAQLSSLADRLFVYMFNILWMYPVYGLSFVLNAVWYQDIADRSFQITGVQHRSGPFSFQRWVGAMAEEIYRIILVGAYMIQVTVCSLVPVVGQVVVVMQLAWLYALYSFEYKWTLQKWTLVKKLSYFEAHWAYMLGFGTPASIITIVFPKFVGSGVFAISFPLFVLLSVSACPVNHRAGVDDDKDAAAAAEPESIYIFRFALELSNAVLRVFKKKTSLKHKLK
jgi:etoposide-induced 2.4 mRNA